MYNMRYYLTHIYVQVMYIYILHWKVPTCYAYHDSLILIMYADAHIIFDNAASLRLKR